MAAPAAASRSWTAWGGAIGPAAFTAAWVIGGAIEDGYSPVESPISRLAAEGASARALMNVGLVALGLGMVLFSHALRAAGAGRGWAAAAVTGVATLGIFAFPLGSSPGGDQVHGAFALIGYASLVMVPLLEARWFDARSAGYSAALGVLAAGCLLGSVVGPNAAGALQRAGLLLAHGWLIAVAVGLLRTASRQNAAQPGADVA